MYTVHSEFRHGIRPLFKVTMDEVNEFDVTVIGTLLVYTYKSLRIVRY